MENKIIVDGENSIVGRLGSYVAKELLKGSSVIVLNSEKTIISGKKQKIGEKYRILRKKGGSSQKGPKVSKLADRLLKRMIRGMLPWDRAKGRDAWKRLRCYTEEQRNKLKLSEEAEKNIIKLNHKLPREYITIKELIELL
jgi:large subunit ribosomal protein L13